VEDVMLRLWEAIARRLRLRLCSANDVRRSLASAERLNGEAR